MSDPKRPPLEDSIRDCYRTWSGRYYDEYYRAAGAYPPVHVDLVRRELRAHGTSTLLDAGCGPASMLRDLAWPGLERWGFDLTPEMVAEAQRVLGQQGVAQDRVWQGSALDPAAYRGAADAPSAGFDAAICFGVLPHVPAEADAQAIANLAAAVRPGGLVAIEARNALFALYTQNRFTSQFFRERLIDSEALRKRVEADAVEGALERLDAQFRMDLPPIRKGYEGEQGYDEVLSRTHVPFELAAQARAAGLSDVRILFYHFHALPPMCEAAFPEAYRAASVAMEDPEDWRGHFMASAFVLVGVRAR
jgi:SAM-dependent methyltransferase